MLLGYVRVSKSDGSQTVNLQKDALRQAGVDDHHIYQDTTSGMLQSRPGLDACRKALRADDVLVVWKLDRLGRSLKYMVHFVENLVKNNIGLKVLTGQGAHMDTTTPNGRLLLGFFATLAEFERDLLIERTKAGLEAARARGRKGGRKFALNKAQVRLAQAAIGQKETTVSELCRELSISKATLYRYVNPKGQLRGYGKRVLER